MIKIGKELRINVFVVLLLIISSAGFYIQGGIVFNWMFVTIISCFVFSVIQTLSLRNRIAVSCTLDKAYYSVGDCGEIDTTVINRSFLPATMVNIENPQFRLHDAKYKSNTLSLTSRKKLVVKDKLTFNSRGNFNFGNSLIKYSDVFFIFSVKKVLKQECIVKVYPTVYDLSFMWDGRQSTGNASTETLMLNNTAAMNDLRKYCIGDSLKRVHWKMSAKHGELYVWNYESESNLKFNVLFNMNSSGYSAYNYNHHEEVMVDFCASLVKGFLDNSTKGQVFINNKNDFHIQINSDKDFKSLINYFTANKSAGQKDFSDFLEKNAFSFMGSQIICIVTYKLNIEFIDKIKKLDKQYKLIIFYYEGSVLQQELSLKMQCQWVDIQEFLDAKQSNRKA
ncbi:MAG: DUF58 domain-containing protein [Bacillota bacterium]|nr:DUF58 domain-containing protein [Bacillota bacterium]